MKSGVRAHHPCSPCRSHVPQWGPTLHREILEIFVEASWRHRSSSPTILLQDRIQSARAERYKFAPPRNRNAYLRKWRRKKRLAREACRRYERRHPERTKVWAAAHRENLNSAHRRWYERNARDQQKKALANYYANHEENKRKQRERAEKRRRAQGIPRRK